MVHSIAPAPKSKMLLAPAYQFTPFGRKLAKMDGPLAKTGVKSSHSPPSSKIFSVISLLIIVDAFFEIRHQKPGTSTAVLLYRSEWIKQSLSPDWVPFTLNVTDVGTIDSPFEIKVLIICV